MLDLSQLDVVGAANKGQILTLLHPATEEELDVKITLMGSDSDEYRETIKKRFEQAQRLAKKKGKSQDIDLEEAEQKSLELLAKLTLGWENVADGGKEIKFTTEAAKDLYKKYPWIREQVERFINDRANFIKS